MALILKYVSRTSNDYKSFVSFLTIPKNESVIGEDELQVILSGISEITEDFARQESIMEQMVALKFTGIKDQSYNNMQNNARQYAKDKLEEHFTAQILEQQATNTETLNREKSEHQKEILALEDRLHKTFETLFAQKQEEGLKEKRDSVLKDIKEMESRKETADRKIKNSFTTRKFWIALIGISYYVGLAIFAYWGYETEIKHIAWLLWILGLVPPVISALWIFIKNESFSLLKILTDMRKRIETKKYKEYQVSIEELNELKEMGRKIG